MELNQIVEQVLRDSDDWFPEARDPLHVVISMIGEMGEFCNEVKKVLRGSKDFAEADEHMQEELVDVFIYLCKLAGLIGLDLEKGYHVKRERNVERFGGGQGRKVQPRVRQDVPGAA